MKPKGRKPTPLQGRGEIRGDAVYPISVLMRRLGIARNTLSSLRRRGLPVHSIGRRCAVVFGWELLAFLRSELDQGTINPPVQSANNGDSATAVPASVPGGPAR